jgi:hypothetical protein
VLRDGGECSVGWVEAAILIFFLSRKKKTFASSQ